MAVALVLFLVVVGSVVFHFASPWWSTPLASNWSAIDFTIDITLVITGVVFILIGVFMAWCVLRYRYSADRRSTYEPENKKLEYWLIGLTTIGVAAMLAPGLVVYAKFVEVPEGAAVFEAVGQQWQWSYRFPGEDGEIGSSDVRFINFDNPFGLDPDDPLGQDDVLINSSEVHLPVGQPVKVLLRSKDVLHDFYVPQFRAKMDLVPGLVTYFWFTPTKTGRFEVLCAELCGVGHYNMRGLVVVDEPAEFDRWLATHATFADSRQKQPATGTDPLSQRGREIAQNQGCMACHSVDGGQLVGPTWQGMFGRTEAMSDGSTVVVDEAYLREAILEPNARIVQGYPPIMPPARFNDEDIEALIAYMRQSAAPSGAAAILEVDDDDQAPAPGGSTATDEAAAGDPAAALERSVKGQQVAKQYGCFACHSDDGSPRIGPTWKGLYGKTEPLVDGSSVLVDDAYLREAILEPNASIVKGFPPAMPAIPISDEDVDALIAYMRSLSGTP